MKKIKSKRIERKVLYKEQEQSPRLKNFKLKMIIGEI